MADKPTMPTPVAAELLHDTAPHAERDERFPGVHLIDVDEDGEGKTTAQRVPGGGWRISDWELTEELEGALGGSRYWFCRSFHTVPDVHLQRLIELARAGDTPYTVCCSREECGGECGNEWAGMTTPNAQRAEAAEALLTDLLTDDDLPDSVRDRIHTLIAGSVTDDLPLEPPPADNIVPPGQWLYCQKCDDGNGRPVRDFKAGDTFTRNEAGQPACPGCLSYLHDLPF